MLHWVIVFLVISLIAALFGFSGIASTAAGFARTIFGIAILLMLITFVMHLLGVGA